MFEVKRMALSKSESNKEISNLACIARVIVGPCTGILQDVLKNQITPSNLKKRFQVLYKNANHLVKEHLNCVYCLIYQFDGNYTDFDIPLLYFFLRSICNIPSSKTEWGHFPSEKDRSLSANIERIHQMYKQYKHFLYESLKDSTFEEDWERIFQTVKELEEYIGSGTANQDAMKKTKNSSMDPDVEHLFIAKLGINNIIYHRELHPSMHFLGHFERIPALKGDVQEWASRDIEFLLNHYDIIGLPLLPHSKEKAKEKSEKVQQITSEKLKELFSSFKVMFPEDDPESKSFARSMLKDDINKIENAIRLLSKGIVLNTEKDTLNAGWPNTKAGWPNTKACVVEVDVVYDEVEDQFYVSRKGISSDVFTVMPDDEDNCINVMLISSDSIPVVSAKLIAYKNFKRVINEKEIYLQHVYEDFDNVAKLIAYNIVSSFCLSLDSKIHTFTNDLHKIMFDNYDKSLNRQQIREMCFDVFERTHKLFGSTSRRRSFGVSLSIQTQLSEEYLTGADAWDEIQNVCRKTVEDFKIILSTLEDFQTNELCVDQKKQIKEWYKRDIFPERLLLEYPSIVKYIAGYREEKEVVKVYLSSDDEEAETFFKTHCEVSKDALFEFVNVEKMNENEEEMEVEDFERENPAVAESTTEDLMQIIRENGKKIFAKYSNVIGIRVGQTTPYRITLYCLDKTIIPFGEQPLPESIAGYPCYVREDFFILGTCPLNCTNDLLEPGCSIGVPEKQDAGSSIGVPANQGAGSNIGVPAKQGAGSVGFFYESKKASKYGSGFITASHVAIESRYQLRYQNKLLSTCQWKKTELKPTHDIVHPKCKNINGEEHIVGKVVESFLGHNDLFQNEGMDFAAVKTKSCRQGKKEILEFVERENLADGETVTKMGKATAKTDGHLSKDVMFADLSIPGCRKTFYLPELYIVKNKDEKNRFFEKGDSGAGVFVVGKEQQDKILGIGIAVALKEHETYVCKIEKVIKNLELTLVRYSDDRQKQTSPSTENSFKENTQNFKNWFPEYYV